MQLVESSGHERISRRSWTNLVFVTLTLAVSSLALACSDSGKQTTTTGGEGGNPGSSSSSSGTAGMGGAGGEGGAGPEMVGPVEEVMKFDPAMGELGEGIAIDGTTAYVSFGSLKVIKIDLVAKTRADFGTLSAPLGVGQPQGLALDGQKILYMAAATSNPVDFTAGIYKFPAGGGTAQLFAQDVNMSYPRHIAFANSGIMVVATPLGSRMFTVSTAGKVNDPGVAQVLSGDQGSACAYGDGIPYGISSVAMDGDSFYGANADRAQLISGGLQTDMSGNTFAVPDKDAIFAGPDCTTMGGAESIVIDTMDPAATSFNPSLIVAARAVNKITRVHFAGGVEVIADGTSLYEPSAMAIAVIGGDRYLYVVNSARKTYNSGGIPGLVRMRLGKAK